MSDHRDAGHQAALRLRTNFGANLRRLRRAAGLTQADVAARTGVPQQHLSKIERGAMNLTVQTLAVLADTVGGEVADMLGEPGHD